MPEPKHGSKHHPKPDPPKPPDPIEPASDDGDNGTPDSDPDPGD